MTSNDKSKLSRIVNKIRAAQDAIKEQTALIEVAMGDLATAMEDAGVKDHLTTLGHAYYKPQTGRATNVVDVRAFAEAVDEDDFYDAVTVSVTKAKDVMPAKALAKITERIEPAPKPDKLVVEEVE